MVKCLLCGQEFRTISWSHLKYYHNMSQWDYQQLFPGSTLYSWETAALISEALSDRPKNPEAIEKMRMSLTGHKHSEESKRKMSLNHSMTLSPEHIAAIKKGKAESTYVHSEATREKISKANIGREVYSWTRKRLSEAGRLRVVSEETKKKISKAHLGKTVSAEARQHMSEADKALWSDPEYARKQQDLMHKGMKPLTQAQRDEVGRRFANYWANLSEGEKDAAKERKSKSASKQWKGRSKEELAWIGRKISEGNSAHLLSLSYEERLAIGHGMSCPESFLELYLNSKFPGKWLYNGDGQQQELVVKSGYTGGRKPDFIRADGTKEVISEMGGFGWYHFLEDEPEEIEHYKKYGFKCTVVWEWDCHLWYELDKIFLSK